MVQAGAEDTHAILVSSPAGFAELVARAGTPALGDVVLAAPGTTPADLDDSHGA